ncbi:MAG: DNA translocase FtsK [Faecousia sp.]
MAKKKTKQTGKVAASSAANKKTAASKGSKTAAKNSKAASKSPKVRTEYDDRIPLTTVTAIISFVLFVLFLVICINPDGLLLKAINNLLTGLIGKAGFYFSVPALLYLFIVNTFGRKNAAAMRSVCTIAFVFLCGCIYHLAVQTQGIASGLALFPDLYLSGIDGRSGGVLCGGLAVLLRWAFGTTVSYIIIGIAAVLTLLGALEITIPSIIRAIINRPKDDWEDEEQQQIYVEPAAMVVNHIANKQIENKRKRRQQQELEYQRLQLEQQEPAHPVELPPTKPGRKAAPAEKKAPPVFEPESNSSGSVKKPTVSAPVQSAVVQPPQQHTSSSTPAKAAGMMSTIDLDIESPLFGNPRTAAPKPATPVRVSADDDFEDIPARMPNLEDDLPIQPPKKEPAPVQAPAPKPVKQTPVIAAGEEMPGKVSEKDARESAQQVAMEIQQGSTVPQAAYSFPPISLLKRPAGSSADGTDEMRENSRRLNETLASFHIDAHIINVTRGPSVTRYEVELDKGVRLNKLTNCADDIALSLGASGVRIAAVPGKISIVGIEVPNRAVTTVSLREVIDSPEFAKSKSKSSFAVGKDIGGSCIVGNIAKMPHMLIAGTTGSGKSVCMNSIIISLLYKSGPEDVKLIMVDPKMVELGIYNGIPHLLIPVVTDPKKAAGSLQWAVTEMLRRYKLMSDVGVRDLESYNGIITQEENGQKLPQVVIIIDELADLMLVAAKEVEDSICRIAQMGRAAGMHLIIATQRPSADVITGLMKANIPSRIAFSVASAMESRIILDTQGAEKLVGKGDMLYAPIGIGKPLRVQGCFVTDAEVEAVASFVKDNYASDYNQQVLEEIEKKAQQAGKGSKASAAEPEPSSEELEGDEMLPAAVDVILETGQASVSMLQRRLKLGYARAARIVDEMEEKGIVGPFQGSKPRAILVTKEQWASMRGGNAQMDFSDLQSDPVPEEID